MTSLYSPRMSITSFSASSHVACAVCPSCHRNSRVRRKGLVALVSHLTMLHHWLTLIGRSLQLLIHLANVAYMMVSDVGRMASFSSSGVLPPSVTHAPSGTTPSKCSDSFFKRLSGMNIGK